MFQPSLVATTAKNILDQLNTKLPSSYREQAITGIVDNFLGNDKKADFFNNKAYSALNKDFASLAQQVRKATGLDSDFGKMFDSALAGSVGKAVSNLLSIPANKGEGVEGLSNRVNQAVKLLGNIANKENREAALDIIKNNKDIPQKTMNLLLDELKKQEGPFNLLNVPPASTNQTPLNAQELMHQISLNSAIKSGDPKQMREAIGSAIKNLGTQSHMKVFESLDVEPADSAVKANMAAFKEIYKKYTEPLKTPTYTFKEHRLSSEDSAALFASQTRFNGQELMQLVSLESAISSGDRDKMRDAIGNTISKLDTQSHYNVFESLDREPKTLAEFGNMLKFKEVYKEYTEPLKTPTYQFK